MLEKPTISVDKIAACLRKDFGISVVAITFLPLGADLNTAVYRIQLPSQGALFFKLRSGPFDSTSVTVPKLLHDQGIGQIIAPLPTGDGRFWCSLEHYTAILYPYIEGKNGYDVGLSDQQWFDFGTLVKQFHTASIPLSISNSIRRESFSPKWRQLVKEYLALGQGGDVDDPIAVELASFLASNQNIILELVNRAERLAEAVAAHPPEFIVCHADIHAGNIHITAEGTIYLIDWDTVIQAPKERDLMSIGGGLMGQWRLPQEEERLFYLGYGHSPIHNDALIYYRCERIIEDLAIECGQIFSLEGMAADREQSLYYLKSNFSKGGTIELALKR